MLIGVSKAIRDRLGLYPLSNANEGDVNES